MIEYAAPDHIESAALVSPEAQILTGPNKINAFNGLVTIVGLGLQSCYGGMGFMAIYPDNCHLLESYYAPTDERQYGKLSYSPSNPNDAGSVIDELSLLLTGGRLSSNSVSRSIIINAYNTAGNNEDALSLAQKLIISTPEFHTTNVMYTSSSTVRPEIEPPQLQSNRYKAVLFIELEGGADSFNMLVPYSGCSGVERKFFI